MKYQWNDNCLDVSARTLTRAGRPVVVSRRVMECICHLAQHRDRTVSHDELIRVLWGHGDATRHQLIQVIVAARRALRNDGNAQGVIRTVQGLGYHWTMPVSEAQAAELSNPSERPWQTDDVVVPEEPPVEALRRRAESMSAERSEQAPAGSGLGPSALRPHVRIKHVASALVVMSLLLLWIVVAGHYRNRAVQATEGGLLSDRLVASEEPIEATRKALRMGLHEDVQEALAKLPLDIADTAQARMLEIELEIERGRFENADSKIAAEIERASAADDLVWKAQLQVLKSERHIKSAGVAADVLRPAQSALTLLAAAGPSAPPPTIGRALAARGAGFLIENDLSRAIQDLVRARDILTKSGDEWNAALSRRYLAHVWLRMGRMTDAREQMVEVADTFQRLSDPINEIGTRNMATRIQAEQLRWEEALASSERNLEASRAVPVSRRKIGALTLRALVLTSVGRLREAQSLIEEAQARDSRFLPIYQAVYALAADRPEEALKHASAAFDIYDADDRFNLNLENREGALLLWMIAAQAQHERGKPMPELSHAQKTLILSTQSGIGRIARARWMWSQGRLEMAETELREVRKQPRAPGWLSETLYANQALIELLLQQGKTEAARHALIEMWGHDPERFAGDYAANLLALRVAVAEGESRSIESAYRAADASAGERTLPIELQKAYDALAAR